jgi:hypothetical protein
MAADSKRTSSPTLRSGTLPSGEIAANQSGRFARSISIRSNATPFSASAIEARCTYGQRWWEIRVRLAIAPFLRCNRINIDAHALTVTIDAVAFLSS